MTQRRGAGRCGRDRVPARGSASDRDHAARGRARPAATSVPQAGQPGLRLLARVGVVDPTSLDDYRAHGGFRALERARAIGPQAVIDEVTASGLVGRGGAAFPTGRKWAAVAAQAGAAPLPRLQRRRVGARARSRTGS